MTIPHFADQQNIVFIPALLAVLVATVLICLPIVFAPALRRGRRRGGRVVVVVAGVAAVVALVVAGWQAGAGARVLQEERTAVAAQLQARYALRLSGAEVNELLNGGAPERVLPQQAAALELRPNTKGVQRHPLRLKAEATGSDDYVLTYGGVTLPAQA